MLVDEKNKVIGLILSLKNLLKHNTVLMLILSLTIFYHLFLISVVPAVVFTDEINPFVTVSSILLHHGLEFISGPYQPFSLLVMTLNLEWQSIILFGHTTFTIRFPGLIFSFFLVICVYFLFNSLFNRKTALWGSLLVSISPAVIQGGRVFYQIPIIAGTVFLTAGVYLILKGGKNYNKFFFLCGVLLISFDIGGYLNIYARLLGISLLTLLLGRFLLLDKHLILNRILTWIAPAIIVLYIITILIPQFSTSSSAASAHTISYYLSSNQDLLLGGIRGLKIFFMKYISYYSPTFLFLTGDINPTANTGLTGEFLFPGLFFFYFGLLVGFYKLLKSETERFSIGLMLFWLVLSPVEGSASIVVNYTDSSVALTMIPSIEFFISIGIMFVLDNTPRLTRSIKYKLRHLVSVSDPHSRSSYNTHRITGYSLKKPITAVAIILIAYGLSTVTFSYDYFDIHAVNVENTPPTWADWGYLFGFPQIAEFISSHNLDKLPIFVSPDGLFGNNLSEFYYFYNVQHIPSSYLQYYSAGKIQGTKGVINVSYFYYPSTSLIISGCYNNVKELSQNGLAAKSLVNITRPDGKIAMLLIEVKPSLNSSDLKVLSNSTLHCSNINKSSIYSRLLPNISNNFTVMLEFSIPKENYTPNKFYCLLESDPSYDNIPRFGFRVSSCSYSPALDGSPTNMTLSSFLYTREGNFSSVPGTFAQIWSNSVIVPGKTYFTWLSYDNNTFTFFVNNTVVNTGKLFYSLAPMSNKITLNTNFNSTILRLYLWNQTLNPQEISYLYYNGGII